MYTEIPLEIVYIDYDEEQYSNGTHTTRTTRITALANKVLHTPNFIHCGTQDRYTFLFSGGYDPGNITEG